MVHSCVFPLTSGNIPKPVPAVPRTRAGRGAKNARDFALLCRAERQTENDAPVMEKTKPDWAVCSGEGILSRAVNAAIQCPPLFAVMKVLAKDALKRTALKNGVNWDDIVRSEFDGIDEAQLIKNEIEDKSIMYPDYYLQEFHAYSQGNLNWLAAFEVIPATDSMALRVYKSSDAEMRKSRAPDLSGGGRGGASNFEFLGFEGIVIPWQDEDLTPLEAQRRLRNGIFNSIKEFQSKHACRSFEDILDEGCSVGISTRWMAKEWPEASTVGLDLSPHFLAVAEMEERQRNGRRAVAEYMHANAESTGLPEAAFDLITVTFTLHECPQPATVNILNEARRMLRPGGVLAITDNDPKSPVIQGLPPVLFTLMKSTEPWSDDYYTFDFEQALLDSGFDQVESIRCDPRHRTIVARAGPCLQVHGGESVA